MVAVSTVFSQISFQCMLCGFSYSWLPRQQLKVPEPKQESICREASNLHKMCAAVAAFMSTSCLMLC